MTTTTEEKIVCEGFTHKQLDDSETGDYSDSPQNW